MGYEYIANTDKEQKEFGSFTALKNWAGVSDEKVKWAIDTGNPVEVEGKLWFFDIL